MWIKGGNLFPLNNKSLIFAFDKISRKEIEVMTILQIISILLKYRATLVSRITQVVGQLILQDEIPYSEKS